MAGSLVGRTIPLSRGVFSISLATSLGVARTFLAGPENAAVRILLPALLQPIRAYLPLVIWGDTGVGKTFLAEGLAESWRTAATGRKLLATDGIDFARRYADAVDTDSVEDFRRSFRSAEFIFCDNVHTLPAKPAAAREFCNLLDHAVSHDKIMLCTCTCSPALVGEPSFASRLNSGLAAPLMPPESASQLALVHHFAAERGLEFRPELSLELLGRLVPLHRGNITPRVLQSAVTQLHSASTLAHCPLDFSLLNAVFPPTASTAKIDLKKIFTLVARRCRVSLAELRSSSRRQSLVQARGVAALLGRELGLESYHSLGQALGQRDHSTIHHAVEKIQGELAQDTAFAAFVDQLRQDLLALHTPPVHSGGLAKAVGLLSSIVTMPPLADTSSGRLF